MENFLAGLPLIPTPSPSCLAPTSATPLPYCCPPSSSSALQIQYSSFTFFRPILCIVAQVISL